MITGSSTLVDLWAMAAAGLAAGFLALRSRMLRPDFRHLVDAPPLVWASLSFLSIACAGEAVTLFRGGHANAREALLMTALAVESMVLFLNLRRQARAGGPLKVPGPDSAA